MKKIIALALVLLMVVPMIASCGKSDKSGGSGKTESGAGLDNYQGINGETVSAEEAEVYDYISKYINALADENNFKGKSFTWVGGGGQAPTEDEETGDISSDALYYRQRDIEDKFGVAWTNYSPSTTDKAYHSVTAAVIQDVMAGSGAYDAGYGTAVAVCQPMIQQSVLADLNNFSGIDFQQDWWTGTLLDTYHINGAVYIANGPIMSSFYNDTYCVAFNKSIAEDYGMDDLYPLVYSGEWTFDKMFEIASIIPANTNGNSAYRFGFPRGMASIYAAGLTVTKFNEDLSPYVDDAYSIELSNLSDKLAPVFGDDTLTASAKGLFASKYETYDEKYGYGNEDEMFAANQVMFGFMTTGAAAGLREQEVTFGILPMPKGDVKQESYVSYAEPWGSFNVFVPKSVKDEKMAGVILESMAALGRRYLKPAYYDNILRSRSTYDYESQEMIDIIFAGKVYDIIDILAPEGGNFGDCTYVKVLKYSIQETNQGIASKYKMQARLMNNSIKTIISSIK